MNRKELSLPIRVFVRLIAAVLIFLIITAGILWFKGYSFTVGKLYFADRGTYLITETDTAFLVFDASREENLFEQYSNGDKVLLIHGVIRETYPMTTDGVYIIVLEKGDGSYKPDDDVVGLDKPDAEIEFKVQYIRTDGYHEGIKYPIVKIIRSVDELNNYYEANKALYNLEGYDDGPKGFLAAIDKYDDAYFKNQILIIVLLEEGSGSNRHKVNKITLLDDETLLINIERIIPYIGTCDMAQWHILIEPKAEVNVADESEITVIIDTGME